MNLHTPEISELKARVEDRYQRNLKTSTDFEEFSLYLSNFFQEKVSASTLKRLWEYVGDSHNPRVNTLDVLARYIDFQSFKAFCEDLKRSTYYNSSFISIEKIMSEELQTGDTVEIGWSPNRIVTMRYEGKNLFTVMSSENSKLMIGDRFETTCLMKGIPLYLSYVLRGEEKLAAFIAGRNGGLTILRKL
jgi:hypothetical protein